MKKVLFVFWHGLGDNILATPAIKAYKKRTNNFVGWAMLNRFKSTELFKFNPYIDQLHYTSDAWNDFKSYRVGRNEVINEAIEIANRGGYDEYKIISHQTSGIHKIYRTAIEMGMSTKSFNCTTEFYGLWKYGYSAMPYKDYVFFHGKSGVETKDLPLEVAEKYLDENNIDLPIVSPDFSWDISEYSIHLAAQVLYNAKHIIVTDSVMYHLAHALGKKIDLAYFQRGKKVYDIVYSLHSKHNDSKIIYNY